MKIALQLSLRLQTCLIIALALAFTVSSQAQSTARSHKWSKRIVADYTNGSKYLNPPYDVAQIPFHKLTHINHAGIPWNSDGSLSIPTGFFEPELIKRAHAHGVKVLLLTGGDFAAVESSPAVLDTVICNLKMFVTEHDYDGLDIDWEFPQSSEDKNFFATLMSKLRAAFPSPRYELSVDIAPWNIEFYPLKRMVPTTDFFNLMVYDCAGPWTSEGHLNSPIFWDNKDPKPGECEPGASDQQALNMYLKTIPASQINLGTPFYGYYYTNINQIFQTCPNAATTADGFCDNTVLTVNYGPNIKQLVNKDGWERYYDPVAFVPYLLRSDGSDGYITYDDAVSTYLRVWYADWVRGAGGTFMWSLDADYDGHSQDLLDAMYRATTGQ
jgi:chitinase